MSNIEKQFAEMMINAAERLGPGCHLSCYVCSGISPQVELRFVANCKDSDMCGALSLDAVVEMALKVRRQPHDVVKAKREAAEQLLEEARQIESQYKAMVPSEDAA